MNKTLETLEVGDLVKANTLDTIEILAVIHRNGKKTVYAAMDEFGCSHIFTAMELEEDDYKPYTETTDSTDEIEQAMKVLTDAGRIVDGKIIK